MNQLIPTPLAIIIIGLFAWGIGTYLVRFSEKVQVEISQSDAYYQTLINNNGQSLEMRRNRK